MSVSHFPPDDALEKCINPHEPCGYLPTSLREVLLQRGLGEGCMVLDLLYTAGLGAGELFDVATAISKIRSLGASVCDNFIRRGLNSELFVRGTKPQKRRGRPEYVFHMPGIQTLMERYKAHPNRYSDPLMLKDFSSLADYRAGLHRQFIARRPGKYSRRWLGARLGVSKRTTLDYDERVGVTAKANYGKRLLKTLREVMTWAGRVKKYMAWFVVTFADGGSFKFPVTVPQIVQGFIDKAVIHLVTQQANDYEVAYG